jgi:S-DNA-T family DNA segregation ATPase FtsK/SpoIIIE
MRAVGVVLLVMGGFFSAAFVSGRGALLGDAGMALATGLAGLPGLLLPPLAAFGGLVLLLGRLPVRRVVGAILLLLAASTTLAAGLPEAQIFVREAYDEAGGIVGSALYAAIFWTGGTVGAVLGLAALYLVGFSLFSGIAPTSAYGALRDRAASLKAWWVRKRAERSERREERQREREREGREAEKEAEKAERAARRASSSRSAGPYDEPPARRQGGPLRVLDAPAGSDPDRTRPVPEVRDLYPELESDRGDTAHRGEIEDTTKTDEFEIVVPEMRGEDVVRGEGRVGGTETAGEYALPSFSLLERGNGNPENDAEEVSGRLTKALSDLGVEARVVRAVVGPRVTRYELRLGAGVKVGKVRNLQQDIAYALAATEVRILAPIPGKSAVGVEVPNTRAEKVTLGDVFTEYPEANDWALPVGLGKDISGRAVFFDLAEMPHLLVAGTTGSGKSVMLNGLLTSLILTTDPREVKMVLVDPKRVELSLYGRIPHLITPVVTDVKKAANALGWAVAEMDRRYEVLEKFGARSLEGYNARADKPMPYVVVVIDELADLMMTAAAKVEDAVIRLAQKARAVGIHLVVATQRPSVDVITGMIKANIPSRIAFAVSSQIDSRVILDTPGAEALLGMGDMLYKPVSAARVSRVQGAFISEREVERIVAASAEAAFGKSPAKAAQVAEARYVEDVTEARNEPRENEEPDDELLSEAASFVVSTQQASVSAVQRRFRVGYSRAGRIIDALERKGVVGPHEGSKSRAVVANDYDLARIFGWGTEAEGPASDGETFPFEEGGSGGVDRGEIPGLL